MKYKTQIQWIWTLTAVTGMSLMLGHWLAESESTAHLNAILVLDAIMFALAMPASLFTLVVAGAASYALEMSPFEPAGAYLNTTVLAILGSMQWFWLTRFYYPPEPTVVSFEF